MADIEYLNADDVLALHAAALEGMGWAPAPLRDRSLLESAVLRPQQAAHYADADLFLQAALLAAGVAENQPFIDGNKRAAHMACVVFLRQNGHRLTADPMELAGQLVALANRPDTLEEATSRFSDWLRTHTTPDK
ncbi:MAG: type II toxin-antitoxin system death-on-curing family toxin [Chloroflexota bacterium]|nr:type II toxin-antitoxin system death-on-curing family toxin [Chloroflexota bacterium]